MVTRQAFLSSSEHLHREYRMSCRPQQLYTPFTYPSLEVRNVMGPTVHLCGGLLTVHLLSGLSVPPLNGNDITPRAALCSNNILPPFNYLTLSLSFSSLFFLFFSLTHSLTHSLTQTSLLTHTHTHNSTHQEPSVFTGKQHSPLLFALCCCHSFFCMFFFPFLFSLTHAHTPIYHRQQGLQPVATPSMKGRVRLCW